MASASALGPPCDLAAFEPADDAIGGARRGQAQDRLQRCSRCRSGRDRALGAHAARRGECGRKPRRTGEHPSTEISGPAKQGKALSGRGEWTDNTTEYASTRIRCDRGAATARTSSARTCPRTC